MNNPIVPLNTDTDAFAAALMQRQHNRDELMQWVFANLREGVDYGIVPGAGDKPTLWQPGAQKICGMLGLRAHFPDAEKYVDRAVSGDAIEQVVVRCHLIDDDGRVVSQGMGAREGSRTVGVYEWQTNEHGQRRRVRVGEREDRDLNYALKMAQKSAHIDATLRAGGLSAIFTQDMPPQEQQDMTPLADRPEEADYVRLRVSKYYPDNHESVLESLAMRRFRIPNGDWLQIPSFRVPYIIGAIAKKWQEDNPGQEPPA